MAGHPDRPGELHPHAVGERHRDPGLPGLTFSGAVQGIQIDPSLLAQGEFPIVGISSIAVTVQGDLFGGQLDAGLVGGILELDSGYNIIAATDTTTPVAHRVFYLGIEGGFSIDGMAGLHDPLRPQPATARWRRS